jgi:hypothetical protein
MPTPSAGRVIWIGVLLGIGFMIAQHLPMLISNTFEILFELAVLLFDWLLNPQLWQYFGIMCCFLAVIICWLWLWDRFTVWRRARHIAAMRKHFVAELEVRLKRDE